MAGLGALVPGFVGRSAELRLLDRMLDAATDGVGCAVSVTGVAGIGKSWFCGEAIHRAQARGFATVRAGCWPGGGAPPLWPWHDVLRELIDDDAACLLVDDGGGSAVDPERFTRFVAVRGRIAQACARRPALVVIDDLHDADPGAVLLCRFLGRQTAGIPLVLIGSRRTGELGDPYEPIDDDHATVVELHGFDLTETAAFLAALGHPLTDDHLLTVLARLTGGHPLHLQSVVAAGLDGTAALGAGPLVTAIRSAVDEIPPETRTRLAYAAVLGNEPSCADAAAAGEVDAGTLRTAVAEATASGLVAMFPGDRFRYAHALVREAFERTLTPAELTTAHARAAAVLAPRITAEGDGWRGLARYAHHRLAAAGRSAADAAAAVEACRTAARAMVTGFAYEQAATLLAAAVVTDEQMLPAPTPAVLLTEWAEAVLRCGRLAEARDLFDRAVVAAERESDMPLFARAGLGLGGVWVNEQRTTVAWERMVGLQQRALDGLDAGQESLRQRLRMRLAVEKLYRHRGTVESVLSALAATRRLGDGRALAEGLSLCHHALLTAEHTRERLPLAEELIAVAATAGDGLHALLGLCWRTVDLFQLGDPRAPASLTELKERIDVLGCLSVRYIAESMTVMTLIRAGRLDEAESRARSCLDLGSRVGDADAFAFYGTHLTMIRWLQGRDADVLAAISDLSESPTLNPAEFGFRATAAYLSARSGATEPARRLLAQLTGAGMRNLPDSSTWLAGMAIIAQTAALLGDAAVAREAYGLLEPYADLPIVPSLAVTCMGSVHHPLGLAAEAFGAEDRAIAHLEAAAEANHRLGNRPFTAIASADLARVRLRRGARPDRDQARALLAEAIADADDMGMAGYAAVWRRELVAVGERGGRIDQIGHHWEVTLDGRRATVPDRVGMRYLARLLLHPGREFPAVDLAGDALPVESVQPMLDPAARAAYRRRIEELSDEMDRADVRGEPDRADRARTEMLALAAELRRATGRGSRNRSFGSRNERARTAVRKAIMRAIDEIAAVEPSLGAELRRTVTTGSTCVYRPADPRIRWTSRGS